MGASEAQEQNTGPKIDRGRQARRGLLVYGGVLALLSALCQGAIMWRGGPIQDSGGIVFALMWSPTVAMIIARLVNRDRFDDVSFRPGMAGAGWRMYLLAWLFPVAVGLLAYGTAWTLGVVPVAVPRGIRRLVGDSAGVPIALLASLGINLTVGTLLSALSAVGEELGWRGYMLTRLIDAGVPRPLLVSGLVWALWHAPLILTGQYAAGPSPVLSTALFFAILAGQGYLYGRLRLATGSVWPAVLLHSAWNSIIQGTFDGFVPGHTASHAGSVWVGEAGVLVVGVATVLAVAAAWRPFPVRRHPADSNPQRISLRTA